MLLLKNLPEIEFTYGKVLSIFIEEPCAHLFPREQKEITEQIADLFRKEKKIETRFFITTHSPYILNVVNNMLRKGNIIENNKNREAEIDKEINFPALFLDEVSASFINDDGKREDMLNQNERMIFAEKIAEISYMINEDTIRLDELNNKLIAAWGN